MVGNCERVVNDYYLALYRDRGDHRHHKDDDPIAVVTLPLEDMNVAVIAARLHDASTSLGDWLASHPEVL